MIIAKADEKTFILRLEKGEDIIIALQNFAQTQNISNAKIEGIGSIENPTLAHYRLDTRKYTEQQMDGLFEITSLLGNIGIFENKPIIHAHVTIGNEKMQLFGGHLVKGDTSATVELIITTYPSRYEKKFNDEIGLKLWELEEK